MICTIKTLKEDLRIKKIYIWNINRDSVDLFLQAALSRIDIQGFVTIQPEYIGQSYMNRPIVSSEQVKKEKDSVVLLADKVSKDVLDIFQPGQSMFWSDSLEINHELYQKGVIIYGVGGGAKQLREFLDNEGISVERYCVTQKDNLTEYQGKPVIGVAEINKYKDSGVIISVKSATYRKEILEALSSFQGRIYIEQDSVIFVLGLIQSIDLAISKNRKIYLYSKKNQISEWITDVLDIYGIEVSGYVGESKDEEEKIESIYDLASEGTDDKLIIINENYPNPEYFITIRKHVEKAGFSLEKENYTALNRYTLASEWMRNFRREQYYDPLVGYSKTYSYGKIGWKLYGDEGAGRIRIMVLGNSTTSEEFHPENWVSKIYNKLAQKNIQTTIYNGAYPDDDIVSELFRLLRDGYVIKPHIVISMSGVNNIQRKKIPNQFNESRLIGWAEQLAPEEKYCGGIDYEESQYSFWSRNIGLLRAVSEFYEARFFGFLQPMNIMMNHMSLHEKSIHEAEINIAGAKEFAEGACDTDGYINIMRLFEHKNEMFIDTIHYTSKAHEIIAEKVCEEIMPELMSLIKEGYE